MTNTDFRSRLRAALARTRARFQLSADERHALQLSHTPVGVLTPVRWRY